MTSLTLPSSVNSNPGYISGQSSMTPVFPADDVCRYLCAAITRERTGLSNIGNHGHVRFLWEDPVGQKRRPPATPIRRRKIRCVMELIRSDCEFCDWNASLGEMEDFDYRFSFILKNKDVTKTFCLLILIVVTFSLFDHYSALVYTVHVLTLFYQHAYKIVATC